jgi:fibro-slime domain-containing protein
MYRRSFALWIITPLALLSACGSNDGPLADEADAGAGAPSLGGRDPGALGSAAGDAASLCGTTLLGTVRDFEDTHPDFEKFTGVDDHAMVLGTLGADGKPQYGGQPTTPSTTGKTSFDQWYRDTPGVNVALPLTIALVKGASGTYSFQNDAFFPIDGQGSGNQGRNHNFHFTVEIRTRFIYRGGETFRFTGDDDIFVFINGKKAIDLGGVHEAESASIDLDARAGELGIVAGETYPLVVFSAERHTVESHIRIDTTIGSFVDCGQPPPK